ncbi:unnamed protein product, partial [Ectocarpus sp. 4 AP-2014]
NWVLNYRRLARLYDTTPRFLRGNLGGTLAAFSVYLAKSYAPMGTHITHAPMPSADRRPKTPHAGGKKGEIFRGPNTTSTPFPPIGRFPSTSGQFIFYQANFCPTSRL